MPEIASSDPAVTALLDGIPDEERRRECRTLLEMMREVTGEEPRVWSGGMVGFGRYHYQYESGREGDWFLTGFAPRKQALTVYVMSGFDRHAAQMARLRKHKTGKSCLYLKRLADIDLDILRQILTDSTRQLSRRT